VHTYLGWVPADHVRQGETFQFGRTTEALSDDRS
jgi:hypothetical protein